MQNLRLEIQEGKKDKGCLFTFRSPSSHYHKSLKIIIKAQHRTWHKETFKKYLLNKNMNTKNKLQSR